MTRFVRSYIRVPSMSPGVAMPLKFRLFFCLGVLGAAAVQVQAQQRIYDLSGNAVARFEHASLDTVDFDGDGDLDVVVAGSNRGGTGETIVYRYERQEITLDPVTGGFISIRQEYERVTGRIAGASRGAARFADYDLDGRPDLLVTGQRRANDPATRVTELYRQDRGPVAAPFLLVRDPSVVLPALSTASAAWADYDGDGDPDLVLAGNDGTGPVTYLFRNDPGPGPVGRAFTETAAGLVGVEEGAVAWGDYDGDGDPDLALSGRAAEGLVTRLYRNDGGPSGTAFVEVQALRGVLGGSLSWGDYDDDGDLDLLGSGGVLDPFILRGTTTIYRNEGGHFSAHDPGVEGTMGSTLWGDYDDDGDLDLLVSRMENVIASPVLLVYENVGGTYRRATFGKGFILDTTLWYDANDDGRLDILTMGSNDPDVGYFYLDMTRITF